MGGSWQTKYRALRKAPSLLTKLILTALSIFNVCVLKLLQKSRVGVCKPLPVADACFCR